MTTVKINAEIDESGNLRLEVPMGLPAGEAEVLVVVQPLASNGVGLAAPKQRAARSGLFVGKPTMNVDVDATLDEMNQTWRSKLLGQG